MPNTGILFWSAFSVFLVINLTCFLVELSIFHDSAIYFMLNLPMICFFTLIEIIAITFIGKDIEVCHRICCISTPCIVRAVHYYALCNMLWFAHRVANCFIVSIYYIAVYPSETISIITLLLSTIIIIIFGITSVVFICSYNNTNKCVKGFNTIILFIIVICIITTLVLITIIFVDLTLHGLSASQIGSTLLAMAIPSVIFVLGLMIERQDETNGNINPSGYSSYQHLQGENAT